MLDKSSMLRNNAFPPQIFDEVAARFPGVTSDHVYIDAGSMMLVTDIVVTETSSATSSPRSPPARSGGLGVAPSGDVSLEHGGFQPCRGTPPTSREGTRPTRCHARFQSTRPTG
jgi:3-isopropylmalate dehydrogenase